MQNSGKSSKQIRLCKISAYIYTINNVNKTCSRNIIKLRINNCDIDFQINICASLNVIYKHDFIKLENVNL